MQSVMPFIIRRPKSFAQKMETGQDSVVEGKRAYEKSSTKCDAETVKIYQIP